MPLDVSEIVDGLIAVCVADVDRGIDSTLLAVCEAYGVELSTKPAADDPGELKHFLNYEAGDAPNGLSVEFVPEPSEQFPLLAPGPILQGNYAVSIRPIWRDDLHLKLTGKSRRLARFMRAFTEALVKLYDPAMLAINGGWTLPSGNVVLNPYLSLIDTEAMVEERNADLRSTELTFVCFTLG